MSQIPPPLDDGLPTHAEPAPPPPTVEPAPTPPLRIHHLMIMMAIALLLMMLSGVKALSEAFGASFTPSMIAAAFAAAVTFTLLGLRWKWRNTTGAWLRDPGDGAALFVAAEWLLQLPLVLTWRLYFIDDSGKIVWGAIPTALALWLQYSSIVTTSLLCILLLVLVVRIADTWSWRIALSMLPVTWFLSQFATAWAIQTYSINLVDTDANFFETGTWALIVSLPYTPHLVAVAWACWRDLWLDRPRSWTHWAGVLALVVPTLVAIAASLIQIAFIDGNPAS